jgi:hypothetical protein
MSEWHMHKLGSGKHSEVWAVNRIRELEKALKDIKIHQELVSGQKGVTWHIVDRALNGDIE